MTPLYEPRTLITLMPLAPVVGIKKTIIQCQIELIVHDKWSSLWSSFILVRVYVGKINTCLVWLVDYVG